MSENKNTFVLIVGLIIIVALLVWQRPAQQQSEQMNAISVSGSAKLDVSPDEAQVLFSVETKASKAVDAQDKNSALATKMIDSLKNIGVNSDDIETTNYHVEIIREWNGVSQKYEERGYRAVHSVRVITMMLDNVGKIVETGVSSGANNVDNVFFTLSKAKQKDVKATLLGLAATNAREKADALAGSLGVSIGKIRSVSESSYDVMPYYARMDAMPSAMAVEKVAPPIQPSDVNVQAQINVLFDIKQ